MPQLKTEPFKPAADSNLDIEEIIGAPLVAAARANSMMLREQTKFLMDFCFNKRENEDIYDPVIIQMSITRGVLVPGEGSGDSAKVQQISTTFNLPLITMIPINSLAVETITIEFDMELTTHIEKKSDAQSPIGGSRATESKTQLRGKLSYPSKERMTRSDKDQYRSESSSKLSVNVKAGPLPLPVGVQMILELYTKAFSPILEDPADKNKSKDSEPIELRLNPGAQ